MTEEQWISGENDPLQLLNAIREKASARQLRLCAVAFCRALFVPEVYREEVTEAIAVAEQFAEQAVATADMLRVFRETIPWDHPLSAAVHTCNPDPLAAARNAAHFALESELNAWTRVYPQIRPRDWEVAAMAKATQASQSAVIRDIFGPVLFRTVHLRADWLSWNNGSVLHVARTIYNNWEFGALPILADALEDAGCDNADILAHCRSGGEHIRGCWVVDLLLGKN